MGSNYTVTIPRGYMLCVQTILHSALISVCCSYTVAWKSPSFHDRYSSPMNVCSLGTLFYTHETAMFGITQTQMPSTPMDSSNVSAFNVRAGIVDGAPR